MALKTIKRAGGRSPTLDLVRGSRGRGRPGDVRGSGDVSGRGLGSAGRGRKTSKSASVTPRPSGETRGTRLVVCVGRPFSAHPKTTPPSTLVSQTRGWGASGKKDGHRRPQEPQAWDSAGLSGHFFVIGPWSQRRWVRALNLRPPRHSRSGSGRGSTDNALHRLRLSPPFLFWRPDLGTAVPNSLSSCRALSFGPLTRERTRP